MLSLYKNVYARLQKKWKDDEEDPRSVELKHKYFSELTGVVAEVGPGAGTNFKYLPKDIRWIGIEPNEKINEEIRKEAEAHGLNNIEIINTSAEQLPLSSNSCDAVIATFVLCSVKNQQNVLAEILRVLKPGGKYIYIEHIAAPTGTLLRYYQNFSNPIHRLYAGNCNVNRDTGNAIKATGFKNVSFEEGRVQMRFFPWPQIWGIAEK